MQNRHVVRLGSLLLAMMLTNVSQVQGGIESMQQIVIDFTKPEDAQKLASWEHFNALKLTPEAGLSWDGQPNESRDFWIKTTRPIALGTSWRPTTIVQVTARIVPPGKFVFGENSVQFPHGEVYVRYSADAKHWSTWQNLPLVHPEKVAIPHQIFSGRIRVPYEEQKEYRDLLQQYSRKEVPWGSDEEAAVKWILESQPDFFKKSIPFIGYVQFLLETSLKGGDRIERLEFNLNWTVGGMHMVPRDETVYTDREGPWRFRAPSAQNP